MPDRLTRAVGSRPAYVSSGRGVQAAATTGSTADAGAGVGVASNGLAVDTESIGVTCSRPMPSAA